jgi:hypothetical protein
MRGAAGKRRTVEPVALTALAKSTAEPSVPVDDDEVTEAFVALLVHDWRRRHPSARPAEDEPGK